MRADRQEVVLKLLASGKYSCTEEGDVVSFVGKQFRIMRLWTDVAGYKRVRLSDSGRTHCVYVHQMIFLAFKGRYSHKLSINHIDGAKTNNHIQNLETATTSEQALHALKLGLRKPFRGKDGRYV